MARVIINSEGRAGTKGFRLVPLIQFPEGGPHGGELFEVPDVVELTLKWELGRGVAVLTLGVDAETLELDAEAYTALEAFVRTGPAGSAAEHGVKPGSVPRTKGSR